MGIKWKSNAGTYITPCNIWLEPNHPINAAFCDRWQGICKIDSYPAPDARIYSPL